MPNLRKRCCIDHVDRRGPFPIGIRIRDDICPVVSDMWSCRIPDQLLYGKAVSCAMVGLQSETDESEWAGMDRQSGALRTWGRCNHPYHQPACLPGSGYNSLFLKINCSLYPYCCMRGGFSPYPFHSETGKNRC